MAMPIQMKPLPSQAELQAILDYDPETGPLRWKWRTSGHRASHFNGRYAGKTAGYYGPEAVRLNIDGCSFVAHRVIWKLVTGNDPGEVIDHRDGNPHNNAWRNLRAVTQRSNTCNRRPNRANEAGLKGVDRHTCGKWRARIRLHGVQYNLGLFDTPEEAHKAYCDAAEVLHGEFARFA